MSPRILRAAVSFAIVQVAYWTYALVAVPLIEPTADSGGNREGVNRPVDDEEDPLFAELKRHFPEAAWELDKPKVLESARAILLFQEYHNLGDGRVRLDPLTMVFLSDGAAEDGDSRRRSALILKAPEGALLHFNKPLSLRQMDDVRLQGGRLTGPITIHSKGKSRGREDDLWIGTSEVELTERHVRTSRPVEFRFGPNSGSGRQMDIKLLAGEQPEGDAGHGLNISGIESIELRHLDRLQLQLGKTASADGKTVSADGKTVSADGKKSSTTEESSGGLFSTASDLPLEVRCRGPFRFNMTEKVATFEDQVDVQRHHPNGPSDQLNCELLSIFFADRTAKTSGKSKDSKKGSKKRPASFDLEPVGIEAVGDPVVFTAPSEPAYARGQQLTYDLRNGRIVLDGDREVILRHGPNEIHARRLDYLSRGPGRLGQIVAEGPGWFRGQPEDQPDGRFEARWNRRLQVRPFQQNQVISLTGGAGLSFAQIGRLEAPEIHFYVLEIPKPGQPNKYELQPDRMLACQADRVLTYREGRIIEPPGDGRPGRRSVAINSAELSAQVEQLEVWFQQPAAKPNDRTTAAAEGKSDEAAGGGLPEKAAVSGKSGPTDSPPAVPRQHFQVGARLLLARLLLPEQETAEAKLSELTVAGEVEFVETRTQRPDEEPLRLRGDWLHVIHAREPHAAATVTGRPARFEGRGLALTGSNINLNRGTNRLWIRGPGQMDVLLKEDAQGRPLRTPVNLAVRWQDHMIFDGRTAQFHQHVTATDPNRTLRTETLEVQFTRTISFSNQKIKQQPAVEQIFCRGGVFMENRTFEEETGRQTSHEQMQVVDLTINHLSGALKADGPGWLTSVRYGSGSLLGRIAAPRNTGRAARPAAADRSKLRRMEVHFQGPIRGNVNRETMTFSDQVRVTYAEVDSWQTVLDADDPASLGPGGIVMRCDELSVTQMPVPMTEQKATELIATGNVKVRGNMQKAEDGTFHARAVRMSYDEAKGLLILEGDGRTDAELVREMQVGGRRAPLAARRIQFWPETHQLIINGIRSGSADFSTGSAVKW